MSYSHFGDLLRAYREKAELTQEQLAELSGLSPGAISNLERGINKSPWRKTVLALADALKLSPSQRDSLLAAKQRITPLEKRTPKEAVRSRPSQTRPLALFGRECEREQVDRLLADDGLPMLLFCGEPGIGKTRLLQEAEDCAEQLGWTVLRGGSQQAEGQHPYAPLIQAIESSFADQTLDQRRQSLKGCEWMARLLPELTDVVDASAFTWQISPEQERHFMFSAVARYLAHLADPGGVLLVLDDLQWAAPDGLSLLLTLIRSTASSKRPVRLRVVAAARDTRLDVYHPLSQLVTNLARDGLVARTQLGLLSMEHASHLLHAALADVHDISYAEREVAIRLALARAGGVPFFLMSFARALSDRRGDTNQILAGTGIPWDATEMIQQRVNELPQASKDLLALAAVHGRETPLTVLASACDLTEKLFIEALETIYASRLLIETSGGACEFAHDLIREAILADLSDVRAKMLHRRVAEALEADPQRAQAEPLAFHYGRSAEVDRAIVYYEREGDRACALRAHAAAEGCYREALSRLTAHGTTSARGRVLEKLGNLLMACGRYADAIVALEEAESCFSQVGDRDGAGRVVAQIGWAHVHGRIGDKGLARVEPLLAPEALTNYRPSTRVALWCAYAILLFGQNRYLEQLSSAQRAAMLAREANDVAALVKSMRLEGLALVQLGQIDKALPILQETVSAAQAVGDLDSYSAALNDTAAVYRARGELISSWSYSARAVEVAKNLGDPTAEAFFVSSHGDNAFLLGDWGVARHCFERAVAIVRDMESSWVAAYPLISMGALNLAEGQDEEAISMLDEAVTLATHNHDLQALRIAHAALAERELLRGAAFKALKRLQPLIEPSTVDEKDSIALFPFMAWAELELGNLANAKAMLKQCLRQANATGNRLVIVDALIAQARLRICQEDWLDAGESLDDALAISKNMACPYADIKARYVYGNLYAARHLSSQAREKYEQALKICRRLGERLYRYRIEQALGRLRNS